MAVKTRMIPTAIVLAALGVAALVFGPAFLDTVNRRKDAVVIRVTFEPVDRSGTAPQGRQLKDLVTIQVDVGNQPFNNEKVTTSPWALPVYPQRDRQKVHVRAEQFYGGKLACEILSYGQRVAFQEKSGPTFVNCVYTSRFP